MFKPRLILHPSDLSALSTYACSIAVDLARQYKADLLILHVTETLGPEQVTYGEIATQLEPEGYHKRLHQQLQQAAPAPPDLNVQYLITQGEPAEQIIQVAHEQHCDLIVVGNHGRTGLARLFQGSTAEQIVRLAPCPVMTVKFHPSPGEEQTAATAGQEPSL